MMDCVSPCSSRQSPSSLNPMQRSFLQWMYQRRRGMLVAPCGNGKSLCLTALQTLMERQYGRTVRMAVVTRTKAMVAVEKANYKGRPLRLLSKESDLLSFHPANRQLQEITCISSTLLPKVFRASRQVQSCFMAWVDSLDLLVIDEIHDFKVYKSAQSVALRRVTDRFQRRLDSSTEARLVGVTATPVHKSVENWHTLMSYIEPRLLGTYWQFLDRWCVTSQRTARVGGRVSTRNGSHRVGRTVSFSEVVGYKDLDSLYQLLSPYLFEWGETDFEFTFVPRYYSLTPDEEAVYKRAITGRGLDKDYHLTLSSPDGSRISLYRDKADELVLSSGSKVRADSLRQGLHIVVDGSTMVVDEVLTKDKDAQHTVRMIAAQKEVSTAEGKLSLLCDYVMSSPDGCLIYCNYKDTVEAVRQRLLTLPLSRRVVVITGDTPSIRSLVAALRPTDVVIVSRVVQQSLDFYFRRLVLFEIAGLTPGSLEQLCGRLSRYNSPYREIEVLCPMRTRGIELYFYERLRLHLKTARSNVYTKEFPPSCWMDGRSDSDVTTTLLKRELLWKV